MRLTSFALCSLATLTLAAFVPADVGLAVIRRSGAWIMAQIFLLWLLVVAAPLWTHRARWREWVPGWREAALVLGATAFVLTREPWGFKVTMDELMLAATAMSLHFGRSPEAIARGYELQGVFESVGNLLDKRPLFYPWLVSLVHDLTGYRMANSFWLNAGLSGVFFTLVYRAARWLYDWRAGVLAVVALMLFPLLAQNATGGGFELLNATLLVGVVLAAARYVRAPDSGSQAVLVLTTLLLAHTRYESGLYVLGTGAVIVGEWIARRRLLIGWPLLVTPWALLPAAWHLRRFEESEAFWQLSGGAEAAFGLEFVYMNLGHFLSYLLNVSRNTTSWPVLGVAAPFGLAFLLLLFVRYRHRFVQEGRADRLVMGPYVVVMLVNLLILLSYYWGQADSYEVSRLLLPFFTLGTLAAAAMLFELPGTRRAFVPALFVLLAGGYAWAIPAMNKEVATRANYHARRMEWSFTFHQALPPGNYLYLTRAPLYFLLNQVSAVHVADARRVTPRVRHHLERRTFSDVFVIQSVFVHPATGEEWVLPGHEVGAAYELETVRERTFRPYVVTRISRVVSIDPNRQAPERAVPPFLLPDRPGEEIGSEYQKFGDRWLRNLP